jgi:hypothetical protein
MTNATATRREITDFQIRNVRAWIAGGMREHGIRWLMAELEICEIRAGLMFDDIGSLKPWTRPELPALTAFDCH